MTAVRVMFVGHGPSNLPEDRVVNVFHFVGVGPYETDAENAMDKVEDFYTANRATRPVAQWLSPWVQRSAELRAYDMTAAKPRVPTIRAINLGANPSAEGYVEEVALCITLHGVVPPALTARRRGRIYIGPLNGFGVQGGTSLLPSRPQPALITDLCGAATALSQVGPNGLAWSIRSTVPAENYVIVNDGYVDNAFDTQRRRGPEASDRTLWTSIVP